MNIKISPGASSLLLLAPLRRHSDAGLLLLRVLVGAFLVWGVFDNIISQERMQEFVDFLAQFAFPIPETMARLSVWAQFFVGLAFVAGLLTRWAGLICAINFIVALIMVDAAGGIRASFPSACLIVIGIYLALHGAGRFSLDYVLESRGKQKI
ncbi:MAG TPA: DoxX family protein [Gammaproteobacteria bacterium]